MSFADMIYGTAQNVEQNAGSTIQPGLQEGASLALKKEELDLQQQHMQLQMQQLQQTKVQKLYDFMGQAHNYTNGAARNNYLNMIPQYAASMGLDPKMVPDHAVQGMGADENMGRDVTARNMVSGGLMTPDQYFAVRRDPEAWAKLPVTPPEAIDMGKVDIQPALEKYTEQQTQLKAAAMRASGFNSRVEQQEYQNALNAVDATKNGSLKGLLTTQQNLQNAVTLFKQGGASVNEFKELQMAVRSNLGIKGNSTGSERSDTYLDSLGLRGSEKTQFLFGDMQSVIKQHPNLAKAVLNMAGIEMNSKANQANQILDTNSKQHQSFLAQHPDRRQDFNSVVDSTRSMFKPPDNVTDLGPRQYKMSNGKSYTAAQLQRLRSNPAVNPAVAAEIDRALGGQGGGNQGTASAQAQ